MNKTTNKIVIGEDTFECHVDDSLMPSLTRAIGGITETDAKIQALAIPKNPLWLQYFIKAIRWYRYNISQKIGNRCVFEPSCSHYAEFVLRENGLVKGLKLTVKRLFRCKPGKGEIDLP